MAVAAPTNDAPKTVAVTYTARSGDPFETRWHGILFEHKQPVDVPADHHILTRPKLKDGTLGPTPIEGNDWFSTSEKRSKPAKNAEDFDTPAAYFAYAAAWIARETRSGALKSRWDNEQPLRDRAGWGADDQDKMDEIMRPKFESLKKDESTVS